MSDTDDNSKRKSEHAFEFFRDWHASVITASGFLITVPLLALSILVSFSQFSKNAILVVAVPTLVSAACFALAIYFMTKSLHLSARVFTSRGSRALDELTNQTKFYMDYGDRFFQIGIIFLVFSILAIVIELVG